MFTRKRSFQHCFDNNCNDNVPGHWKSNLLFRNMKHSLFLFWTRIQLLIVNYTPNVYLCYYPIELSRTSLCNQMNHKKKMMHLFEVFPVKMNNKVYVIINVIRKNKRKKSGLLHIYTWLVNLLFFRKSHNYIFYKNW